MINIFEFSSSASYPLKVHCQPVDQAVAAASKATTALSTSLSDILSSIFTNVYAIPWDILSAVRSLVALKIDKGAAILGDVSKGVGVTINSAGDTVFDLAKSGTQTIGKGFNDFGDYVKSTGSTVAQTIDVKKENKEEKKE